MFFTPHFAVEFRQTGVLNSQVVWFPRVRRMTDLQRTQGGRSAIQQLLNGNKLIARDLASMVKIRGTLRISRLVYLRKHKSVNHALGSTRAVPCLYCFLIRWLKLGS